MFFSLHGICSILQAFLNFTITSSTDICSDGKYSSQILTLEGQIFAEFSIIIFRIIPIFSRWIFIVCKMLIFRYYKKPISGHHIGVEWNAVQFVFTPVRFETWLMVVTHLNDKSEKCKHIFHQYFL
jgi:hypothetical protein